MPELITVPCFNFPQGDPFAGDGNAEVLIQVQYYDNCISLQQEDNSIVIHPKYFEALVREIRKHKPEAEAALKRMNP